MTYGKAGPGGVPLKILFHRGRETMVLIAVRWDTAFWMPGSFSRPGHRSICRNSHGADDEEFFRWGSAAFVRFE